MLLGRRVPALAAPSAMRTLGSRPGPAGIARFLSGSAAAAAPAAQSAVAAAAATVFSPVLDFVLPEALTTREAFQLVSDDGKLRAGAGEPAFATAALCTRLYESMVRLQVLDHVLYEAQRQGRISFYMQTNGEEGAVMGSAAALRTEDTVFAQYRESGVLLWRGFSLQQFADQCFSNVDDKGKGRQMPIHYGSKELNFHTVSSPLTTQVPQAVGAAFAVKGEGADGAVVAAYFGEGAASEGDFHAGLNFAATLECPVLFLCRNNQYAISTPVEDQYRGDGVVSRAAGYGMASVRVDGNDVLAVYEAVRVAREHCRTHSKPVLIEMMSYRVGHHSTSDDSTAYRSIDEIEHWRHGARHPIARMRVFMEDRGMWAQEKEDALREETRAGVLKAITRAEDKDKPEPLENLFADVYDVMPPQLEEQQRELTEQLEKYPKHYAVF